MATAGTRLPSRSGVFRDGGRPRGGSPEGDFPNLDEVKHRPAVRPRAPQPVSSSQRSRRKPLAARNGRRVGDPLPAPTPLPSPGPQQSPTATPGRAAVSTGVGDNRMAQRVTGVDGKAAAPPSTHARLMAPTGPQKWGGHKNLLAWNFPTAATVGYYLSPPSEVSSAQLPSSRPSFGTDVEANPGFHFFLTPMPQAQSSKVVFASNRDGNAEIYSMFADGTALTRLTSNLFNDDHPRWSPDGTKILFQSDRDNPGTGSSDIYLMNPDGTGVTRLTNDPADDSTAEWSPDGAKIVFQSFRNGVHYQIYVMNANGSNQVNLSNSNAADYQPSWSPNGTKIAFASERDHVGRADVYVMNANGSNLLRLTVASAPFRNEQPAWSRDATRLAFVSNRDSVIESWQETGDEGEILFKSSLRSNKEVYAMSSDGSNQIRLTNTLENDDSPYWSPDGTQIIFRSDRECETYDPTQQLWTTNADGTGQSLLVADQSGNSSPSWNGGEANQSPIANAGGPYLGLVGQNTPFNSSASFDPDGTINSYSWAFGDGGTGSGASPTHSYPSAGTYSVSFTVTDNLGAHSTANTTVTITNAGAEQYLQNFNLSALARPFDPDESSYWNDILRAAFANGPDSTLLALREMGMTLFESSDYAARGRNNHWYVYDLYKAFLMREPDGPGWAFWESQCNNYGRDNVRRAFDESGEFAALVATLNPGGLPSAAVSSFASARVNPFNQPGGELKARDAEWSLPLLSLPGRSGLDLGLSLTYSSLIWTRSGPYIYFDEDNGWPSPGFRLGFPTIQEKFFDAQAGDNVYLLIAGSRVSLRQVGTSNVYQAADSSYLQLIDNGGNLLLRSTDGTQLSYSKVNNEWHCTQIKDRNGNYITVSYDWLGQITSIADTVARTITFNYDGNANLTSITQSWTVNGSPTTHTWATFGWATQTVQTSFPGLMAVGAPNLSQISVLSQVGLHDGSRYNFEYAPAGQVNRIRRHSSDNALRSYTAYDYQTGVDDCPRLSTSRVSADNWSGINGVPSEVVTQYSDPGDGSHQLIAPDGTIFKEFYGAGWQRGLATQSEIWSAGIRQKWTTTNWIQDNTAVSFQTNPRATEINVYDAAQNRRRTTVDYQTFTLPSGLSCNLPSDVREYAANASTVLRRSHTDYRMDPVADQVYLSRHFIGLVKEQTLHEVNGGSETLMSKVSFVYDEAGSILGADAPVSHDQTFDSNFVQGRANLTGVKRHDVENPAQFIVNSSKFNTAGSIVSTTDPLNHTVSFSYNDSFSANGVNLDAPRSFSTLAFPTTITDADGHSSHLRYSYDFGARTRIEGPPPANQPQGAIQIFAYDAAARIERVTTANNGAYQRYVYGPNYLQTFATVNTVADEAYSIQLFDGAGQVTGRASNHPGSTGGYSAQNTIYDSVGRAVKQSNPTEINSAWTPAGDDAAGWLYTEQTYNWQGRPRVTTNTDGTTKEAEYSGCGCAGGEVVTLTDEGTIDGGTAKRRQKKIYADIFGRTVKQELLNWQGGSVYSTTLNTYNARDQITQVRQYQGSDTSSVYQDTVLSYDGHGRLKTRHTPEQDANTSTTFSYNADDTVVSVIDARGASQTISHNSRGLVTGINYSAPAGIAASSSVSFQYDPAGNRISMTDGQGSVNYQYDQLSRLTAETRTFSGVGAYPLNYAYNLANLLTSVNDQTFSTTAGYNYDSGGRVSGVTGAGYTNVSQFTLDMQYRAWGGLKAMSYGNGKSLSIAYNSRLNPSSYSVPGVMSKSYQYYADGRLDYEQDLVDARYDRKNNYDHAAQLTAAFSGAEARGLGATDERPFNQTYQHDAFGHTTMRTGKLWAHDYSETSPTPYVNNRRAGWNYDASGHWLDDGAVNALQRKYDAAGRLAKIIHPAHPNNPKRTDDYDGDSQRIRSGYDQPGCSPESSCSFEYTHYLRSSVLGGQIISEIGSNGQKSMGYVYNPGGGMIAVQKLASASDPAAYLLWRHSDPANASVRASDTAGYAFGVYPNSYHAELDPLGADAGLEDAGETQLLTAPDEYNPAWLLHGDPTNLSGGCKLDGMPIDCSDLSNRMDMGTVAVESRGLSLDTPTGRRSVQRKIVSYGLGIFRVDLPYRAEDGVGFRDVLFSFAPQKAKTPYVDEKVLNGCTEDYFGVSLISFKSSVSGGVGEYTGTGPSYLGVNPNGAGNNDTFTIRNDAATYSRAELTNYDNQFRKLAGKPPHSNPILGLTQPRAPLKNYTGNDIKDPMRVLMTQIHELGHSLDTITSVGYDDPGKHSGTEDLGGQILADCVRQRGGFREK
ncbi:MAG TPA: PKD domain-containing protein [Pyrinomonadaceae bacterium]|nr:PKD domain-containing protein [Pyrinomonadaceae bacterium]